MPDAYTHAHVAMNIAKEVSSSFITKNYKHYIIGSQGPDPYFYNNFLPWKSANYSYSIGSKMHHKDTKKLLEELIKNANEDETKALVLGMLTHYALDTSAHPYIYYVTGLYNSRTKENRGTHLELERAIDNIIIEREGNNPRLFNIGKAIFPKTTFKKDTIDCLSKSLNKVYKTTNGGEIYDESYRDFRYQFTHLAYDPLGIKKQVYKLLDKFIDSSIKYSAISHFKIRIEGIDYMNLEKKTWYHPITNEASNETFYDLMHKAEIFGTSLVKETLNYFETGNNKIFSLIKNLCYSSGLEIDNRKMIHFDPIL